MSQQINLTPMNANNNITLTPVNNNNTSNVSFSGPGSMSGPGAMMSGPGGVSNGPGSMMSGPGVATGGANHPGMVAVENQQGPECAACGEMIFGQVISAAGSHYHPDHFICEYCSQPFPNGRFIKGPDDLLYCERDYQELYAKRCHVCKATISGPAVNVKGTYFHKEHFCCVTCGTSLIGKKAKLDPDNKDAYCNTCMAKRKPDVIGEEHMCGRCKRPIIGPYLLLHGQYLHPEHFRCTECGCELGGGNCYEYDSDYYCRTHYDALLRKQCAFCNKPIMGRSINALGKVWHPEHFCCTICNVPFLEQNYYEEGGQPYCEEHYVKLFGTLCAGCGHPILEQGIGFMDKQYHEGCFQCTKCDKHLRQGNFTEWDSQPMCTDCFKKLPKKIRKRVEQRKKAERKAQKAKEKAEKNT
eukprot:TRINITY_DN355_c0_g1_i3.p1 TRINITY_DN355_c0_g1~~TRINITY_DN355_c0_g1_i3.p1  ORF type:complete len:413 (-),score=85.46 TRINITY_DN355_c0_g1_i3:89-1327(-)